jgi:hypothetical protein
VLREDAFAFFNTSWEIALLVKFGKVEELLTIIGGSSYRMYIPECLESLEESN